MTALADLSNAQGSDPLHSQFLALLPKIDRHARIYFSSIRCPATRADRIAECRAVAWKWLQRLTERGKDISQFTMVFVFLVARAVRAGRRLTGQEKATDVLSARAQQLHDFTVNPLPSWMATAEVASPRCFAAFKERLAANTRTPPDEQAMFRIDFADWLASLTPRERQLIGAMAMGERTKDLSKRFELSPGRISQMRREFHDDWTRFSEGTRDQGCLLDD